MEQLKEFNYRCIYTNSAFKPDFVKVHQCYEQLFAHYLERAEQLDHPGHNRIARSPGISEQHCPAALVREAAATLSPRAAAKGLALAVDIAPDTPMDVGPPGTDETW